MCRMFSPKILSLSAVQASYFKTNYPDSFVLFSKRCHTILFNLVVQTCSGRKMSCIINSTRNSTLETWPSDKMNNKKKLRKTLIHENKNLFQKRFQSIVLTPHSPSLVLHPKSKFWSLKRKEGRSYHKWSPRQQVVSFPSQIVKFKYCEKDTKFEKKIFGLKLLW